MIHMNKRLKKSLNTAILTGLILTTTVNTAHANPSEISQIINGIRNKSSQFTVKSSKTLSDFQNLYINTMKSRPELDYTTEKVRIYQTPEGFRIEPTYLVDKTNQTTYDNYVKGVAKALKSKPKLEQIIEAHDVVLDNVTYSEDTFRSPHSPLTIIEENKGVCQAYALLLNDIYKELGIATQVVVGEVDGELHMWLKVRMNGLWYIVDPTFNDREDGKSYEYMLTTDSSISDRKYDKTKGNLAYDNKYSFMKEIGDGDYHKGTFYFQSNYDGKIYSMNLKGDKKLLYTPTEQIRGINYINGDIYFITSNEVLTKLDIASKTVSEVLTGKVQRITKENNEINAVTENGKILLQKRPSKETATSRTLSVLNLPKRTEMKLPNKHKYNGITYNAEWYKGDNKLPSNRLYTGENSEEFELKVKLTDSKGNLHYYLPIIKINVK